MAYGFIDSHFKVIKEYVNELEDKCHDMQKKLDELNCDAEIQVTHDEKDDAYARLVRGFNPDSRQWAQIEEWEEKHLARHHNGGNPPAGKLLKHNPNAATFIYAFQYSHLGGPLGSVYCQECKKAGKKDAEFFFGEV